MFVQFLTTTSSITCHFTTDLTRHAFQSSRQTLSMPRRALPGLVRISRKPRRSVRRFGQRQPFFSRRSRTFGGSWRTCRTVFFVLRYTAWFDPIYCFTIVTLLVLIAFFSHFAQPHLPAYHPPPPVHNLTDILVPYRQNNKKDKLPHGAANDEVTWEVDFLVFILCVGAK